MSKYTFSYNVAAWPQMVKKKKKKKEKKLPKKRGKKKIKNLKLKHRDHKKN